MEVFTPETFRLRRKEVLQRIKDGEIFIHPTDTIYGLGCNAQDEKAVSTIRRLKKRPENPFSVWAPSVKWIQQNCQVEKAGQQWIKKLPGPYTLVLPLKNTHAVAASVHQSVPTLGVRLPKHWFSAVVEELGIPLVTTSANQTGQHFMTSLEDLDPEIEEGVSFAFYEGPKEGRPSQIVDLTTGKVRER